MTIASIVQPMLRNVPLRRHHHDRRGWTIRGVRPGHPGWRAGGAHAPPDPFHAISTRAQPVGRL